MRHLCMCLRNLSLRIQCGSLPRESVSMQFRVAAAWTRPVRGKSLAVLPKPRASDHAKIAIEIGVNARRGNKWNQKREARSSNNRALPIHHHHRPSVLFSSFRNSGRRMRGRLPPTQSHASLPGMPRRPSRIESPSLAVQKGSPWAA